MNEPTIRFPVVCPLCGAEAITEYPVADVASALLNRSVGLKLYTPCHDYRWTASQLELQQVREYMGAWLTTAPDAANSVDELVPRRLPVMSGQATSDDHGTRAAASSGPPAPCISSDDIKGY
jgi:hypothetical protein